jgi:xanthine dehydrogenase accessory factor
MTDILPDWPLFGLADDPRPALRACRDAREATIVALDGGGPRPLGTQMVIAKSVLSGFLSGGCLEADVAAHAATVLSGGEPRRLVYGEGSPWPDIRLLCGARIEVLVEAIAADDAAVGALIERSDARAPVAWRSDGRRRSCDDPAWPAIYEKRFDPKPRLIVLGGDPTALAIATLGAQAGCETTLVRPRGPSQPPPIPGVAYRRDDPAEALHAIGMDPWTAVAVATHDAIVDHEALLAALPSSAFYVGALGARRRLDERLNALRRAGIAETDIARLHAPIGLDIGGKAPWEVAISVLAEIVALREVARLDQALESQHLDDPTGLDGGNAGASPQ